jgi:hypothetical protein
MIYRVLDARRSFDGLLSWNREQLKNGLNRPLFGGFFTLVRPSSWIYLNPSTSKLLYILVYNAFWLAPDDPRHTIVLVADKLLGVVIGHTWSNWRPTCRNFVGQFVMSS